MHLIGVLKREYYRIMNRRNGRSPAIMGSVRSTSFPPFPATYHIMTRIFGSGRIIDIEKQVPALKEAGFRQIWISPVHTQTSYYMWKGRRFNDHGYWPASHVDIDPRLGTGNDLQHLIATCAQNEICLLLDIPVNHFGYGSAFALGNKKIKVKDLTYFRKHHVLEKKDLLLYQLLDHAENDDEIFRILGILEDRCLHELPTLQHTNPEVQEYLISSYKRFIDLGVTAFRIDAAKHIPIDFIVRLMNELSDHAGKSGRQVSFLLEYWMADNPLFVVWKHLLKHVENRNIVFQDHELMVNLRVVFLVEGKRNWKEVKKTILSRRDKGEYARHLISIPDSHDYAKVVERPFDKMALYFVSEFLSHAPIVIHHGKEAGFDSENTNRRRIDSLKFDSEFFRTFQAARQAISGTPEAVIRDLYHEPCLFVQRGSLRLAVNLEGKVELPEGPKEILASLGNVQRESGKLVLDGESLVLFVSN